MKKTTLDNVNIDQEVVINNILNDCKIKRRLLDIGFIPGTKTKVVLKNKGMIAYLIRGAVIALRKEDLKKIEGFLI